MPQSGLQIVSAPGREPGQVDWMALAEARRAALAPHLRNASLKRLGDVTCIYRPSDKEKQQALRKHGSHRHFSQAGIFFLSRVDETFEDVGGGIQRGRIPIWGLREDGQWFFIWVVVERGGDAGESASAQRFIGLETPAERVTLVTICEHLSLNAQNICDDLWEAVRKIVARREQLLREIAGVLDEFDLEYRVIRANRIS